jgi:hypothetical protein
VHAGGVEGLTRKAAVYLSLLLVAMLWARDARGQEPRGRRGASPDSRPRQWIPASGGGCKASGGE